MDNARQFRAMATLGHHNFSASFLLLSIAPILWLAMNLKNNFEKIAKLLIDKGADINIQENRGITPIFLAARNGNLSLVKMLVDKGADPNAKIKGVWVTPLSWSAENGHISVVNYLIDQGVDIDTGSIQLKRFSITQGLGMLFNALKERGANFNLRNNNGGSLLHLAAEGGDAKIIEYFIQKGSELDKKDRYEWTPLHYAAYSDKKEAVSYLIEKGSKLNERDFSGKTAYNIANDRQNSDIPKILKDAGASTEPQHFPEFKGKYLGQKEPGLIPELFAPGIVSSNNIEHGNVAISPDGNEIFWTSSFKASAKAGSVSSFKIWSSSYKNGKWTVPRQVFFTKNEITTDDVPFFSPDGSRIFFMSRRATTSDGKDEAAENYWYVFKKGGKWSSPVLLYDTINTFQIRWQISVSRNGTLYFGATRPDGKGGSDIYRSKLVNGKYSKPEILGTQVNSQAEESTPYVAPDERYIIFAKESRVDRNFKNGLYISFENNDGSWTSPLYLGDEINKGGSSSPFVSPDGKYLFFNNGRNGNYDIYWVSAKIIEDLRPKK
jgi:ankyrin repeat protein